jgi:hypothetical protein
MSPKGSNHIPKGSNHIPKGSNRTKKEEQENLADAISSSSFHESISSFGETLTSPIKKMGMVLLSPLRKSKRNLNEAGDCRDQTTKRISEEMSEDMKIMMVCKELEAAFD